MLKVIKSPVCLTMCYLLFFSSSVFAENCQLDNVYLQAMPESKVTITNANDEELEFQVKIAANNRTRQAGFQRICESTIEEKPILFIFEKAGVPQFHMRNVVAPIDIAFIDEGGVIESIQSMLPYVIGSTIRPLYSPGREVIAALEVHQGFYQKYNIEDGAKVEWELVPVNQAQ